MGLVFQKETYDVGVELVEKFGALLEVEAIHEALDFFDLLKVQGAKKRAVFDGEACPQNVDSRQKSGVLLNEERAVLLVCSLLESVDEELVDVVLVLHELELVFLH